MRPCVSVIVPVYNVEKYLSRCVDSILNQTYENLEIIFVDDGSKDNSAVMCDKYTKENNKIKVLHKTNGGLSSARNAGIEASCGEYLCFVDSDDCIEPTMIEKMVTQMQVDGSNICCCGRFDVYGNKKARGLSCSKHEVLDVQDAFIKLLKEKECDVSTCDKIFHRSLFDGVTYPIGEINEDAAVIHLLFSKAKKISFIPDRFYNYCHRESSITTSNFTETKMVILEHGKAIREFVSKNYPVLTEYAEYFFVKKLLEVCILINLSDRKTRKKYKKLYKEKIKEIKQYKYLLTREDKLKFVFLRFRVYFLVKPIIKKIKLFKATRYA